MGDGTPCWVDLGVADIPKAGGSVIMAPGSVIMAPAGNA